MVKNAYPTRRRPRGQMQPTPGRDEVQNAAGGYVFQNDPLTTLRRFLILGVTGGTYYVSEQDLLKMNVDNIDAILKDDDLAAQAVAVVQSVLSSNSAPRMDPSLFVLAKAAAHPNLRVRKLALAVAGRECRIPTHYMAFLHYLRHFRGLGRAAREVFQAYYEQTDLERLSYHMAKYRGRYGYSHGDVIRLTRPNPELGDNSDQRGTLYQYAMEKWTPPSIEPIGYESVEPWQARLIAIEECKGLNIENSSGKKRALTLIDRYRLTREMIPNGWLSEPAVWEALALDMPYTATMRTLNRMTSVGLLQASSGATDMVVDRLTNEDAVRKSRVHPMAVYLALSTYRQGRGVRGNLRWTPVRRIMSALEEAFHLSLGNIGRSDKKLLIGVDSSGSMTFTSPNGVNPSFELAMVLALVYARANPNTLITHYWTEYEVFPVNPNASIWTIIDMFKKVCEHGGTDCSLPVRAAIDEGGDFDAILTITDGDTWAGHVKPVDLLDQYRRHYKPEAKAAVIAMTASDYNIYPESDMNAMQFAGFDTSSMQVLNNFLEEGDQSLDNVSEAS